MCNKLNKEVRAAISWAYYHLVDDIMSEMSVRESRIIGYTPLGPVKDDEEAYNCDELRNIIQVLLGEYYSTESMDKWNEFKDFLKDRIKNKRFKYSNDVKDITEITCRTRVTHYVLKRAEYLELEYIKPAMEASNVESRLW